MKTKVIMYLVRMVLYNEDVKEALFKVAKNTTTEIDDKVLQILYDLIGG